MRRTIGMKLAFLTGILLCLCILLGFISYRGVRTIHTQITEVVEVKQPAGAAAYEMDLYLLRMIVGVLGYLENRDEEHLNRINVGREKFKESYENYKRLMKTDKGKQLGQEANILFSQFDTFARALVEENDRQYQKMLLLLQKIDTLEHLFTENIQKMIAPGEAQAYQKLKLVSEMEATFNETQRFLGDYIRTNLIEYAERISIRREQFEQAFGAYQQFTLSEQEIMWIDQLQNIYQETVQLSDEIMTLKTQSISDVDKFIELRRALGTTLLYEKIILDVAQKDLLESKQQAVNTVERTDHTIIFLLVGSIIFGVVFGTLLARSIISPLKEVVAAASQIAVGNLSVMLTRRSKDEIGLLAHSFRQLIAYIQDVARIAEHISVGDLQVKITPKSEQDVLNTSLQNMITYLQNIAAITEKVSNKDLQVEVHPKSEQDVLNQSLQRMVSNLYAMIQESDQQNWLQNGLNQLNNALLGEPSLLEVCNKALRFVSRYVNAGSGALYVYDADEKMVGLMSSYAFTERDRVSNRYKLGEGVVGQVALEKAPILLRNIRRQDAVIRTGITSKPPLNTYTFPLVYNQELYGVLELASFERFDQTKQQFLTETNRTIATVIYSTRQREQVQALLQLSQQTQKEAENAAREAELAKEDAQRKAEDVQKANAQLEEQQQKLQQQSEELRQVNAHLKEQQQQLQQQSEELRQQNESLNLAREQLNKRAKELELSSKYKSEFLANMSHELRTPLNSIILLSKMLSRNDKKNLDEKDVKQATVIHQAGEELLRLINDILDLSKIEAGKVTMNITAFTTENLLTTFKDLFHSVAEEKGLDFIIQNDMSGSIKTDKDKLSQVIRNLLSNAFKFTKQGSVLLSVSPHPTQKTLFQITVQDTGIGIPEDKQALVFEAFQQADGSTSREFGGTGLGLAIAREYVRLLQGSIELKSKENSGTTFTLTLPLEYQETGSEEKAPEEHPAEQTLPIRQKQPVKEKTLTVVTEVIDDRTNISSTDKVILIIEDNADMAQMTMDVTREMGFKVLVALDGRTGLLLAQQFRPAGILLDLVLPDMNGMEILRELKSTRELRHIPVHIVSSKERDNTYRYAGAIGYYQKPLNDLDIQHAIENIMSVSEKYPKQLLIVEDDETQREAITEWLGESNEITIIGVSSQEEAIHEIEKGVYDAAIIDLELKDGNGYDICKYIKEHNMALPVIIYTGRELTEEEERELRKYTDSIIIKTARSYERLSDEVALFLHKMYAGDAQSTERSPIPRQLSPTGNLEGKKILIVDDDVKNVFVLASALENNGATVIDAPNGQVALDTLRQHHDIDLVLMDVMMPVMDGYTAIRQIRKDDTLKHLPIIALTAKALKGDRQKCIQAGADDYLSKPVDYDGLIRLAKAWIEK
ncbi:putative signal transduction histidine kinase [Candidatus Vecturithrix granuli]|uniref:histidine kinase n=1 Tax=Vecturithrix granuli TaxID=1499967 RepID=A0A081C037_VECG1|nr:putative signal transduction histidine kinase [Candidatus Vecturithrix granuli]